MDLVEAGAAVGVRARPHTRQRVAFSLTRVPQVGQTFVLEGGFWYVIGNRNIETGEPPGLAKLHHMPHFRVDLVVVMAKPFLDLNTLKEASYLLRYNSN